MLQTLLRAAAARQLYAGMLAAHRAAAATKLQAAWRGKAARQAYSAQQQAATLLQSAWRAAAVRQQYRQHQAAALLQSAWRAAVARQQYRQQRIQALQLRTQHRAARKIQRAWRNSKQPTEFDSYPGGVEAADAAARTIQTIWRERDQHNSKVRRLQAAVRQLVQWHAAAVVLQSCWRGHAARVAATKAREQQRRAAFKQQMKMFEQAMTQQQQELQPAQQQHQGRAGPARRFLSDTDAYSPMGSQTAYGSPNWVQFGPAVTTTACVSRLPPAGQHAVHGFMQAAPKPASTGVQFAGLPKAGGQSSLGLRFSTTPGSPGASSDTSRTASLPDSQSASSPRPSRSPSGHRSSWVLPPPPPAGYGIGYEGINGDRNPLKPGVVHQQSSSEQPTPRSSRSLKLFAPPPPAAYGVSYAQAGSTTSSSNGSKPADAGTTCVRARLLEPAPAAAYGVQYSGIGSSSSSGSSINRPRLFQSASFNGGSGASRSGSSGLLSPSRSFVDGLKERISGSGKALLGDDEKPLLLLEEELVRSDDSPSLSPEERLSTRLGGLWEEKGKVSNLLSSWKQRLSAQA